MTGSPSASADAIERTRRKRAGEAVRARLAARAAAVGSRGYGRHGRVPARRRDQTAGVRTGRGRLSRSRLQRAARRGGREERAPLPLSVGAGARRQAPDPVGVDRIRGQTPEFGTAGRAGPDRDRSAGGECHVGAGGRSTESGESRADVAAAAGAADFRDRLADRGGPGRRARDPRPSWRCAGASAGRSNRAGRLPRRSPRRPWRCLLAENLPARGLVKEFYLRLTGIVRQYVEDTTGIRAPEQTTEEFLRDMRSRAAFPPERSVRLAEFLEAADLIKYAGQQPRGGSD